MVNEPTLLDRFTLPIVENPNKKPIRLGWIIALMTLTVGYRVFSVGNTELMNTSPLMAMAFGGGLLLGRRFWWIPAVLLVVSDIALGFSAGTGIGKYTMVTTACYSLAALAGAWFGKNTANTPGKWPVMWLGTMICSILFYLAANSFSWALSPAYAKTMVGWWQSQTTGLPGFPPSLLFLRNALIGDTTWCIIAAPLFFWSTLREPKAVAAIN